MPNLNPLAQVITELSKLASKLLDGVSGRRTRAALDRARRGMQRALKQHPELRQDKTFMKYWNKFKELIAKN